MESPTVPLCPTQDIHHIHCGPVYPVWIHWHPVTHFVAILVLRSTIAISQCLQSRSHSMVAHITHLTSQHHVLYVTSSKRHKYGTWKCLKKERPRITLIAVYCNCSLVSSYH
jgi:hypothetical protein